ncbi:xanthotoxin 5-hydroxylase CYP82C2-like [Impatiens glandulifera]|uniref:xanthotoxin 5-hydroxylase CYP82C2-like n=1 Tax=Impatiens glandulifera TaxID=253017 RepID=UPI001FB14051|nr:xanthotoxin 5-hydroxylase CYP82C2-like [Impatiens glandulifera]
MEFLQQLLVQVMIVLIFILLGFIHFRWFSKFMNNNKRKAPPQPAGAWPIIGHIPLLLGGKNLTHRILSKMADNFGSVFSLRMGFHETVVINNCEVAKECFTTNDKTLSTRPKSLAFKLLTYDQTVIAFAPYGPNWRAMRKFVVLNLLTAHRLHMLRHVRFSEIDFFIKSLYQQWDHGNGSGSGKILVEFKEMFQDMSSNIITRIIAGKRYAGTNSEESKQCQNAITKIFNLLGLFLVSDAIPSLGWIDILNGNCAKMKRAAKEIDDILVRWLREHREKRLSGCIKDEDNDLIHLMLSDLQDGDLATVDIDTDTVLKSTCLAMILGGNDTISVSMTWVLCFILNNRDVLCKAREELDTHVGRHRLVEESDIKNLVYLQAIFKESIRLQPTFPLLLMREAMEDCNLGGFEIPAGTHLLVNIWKIHRDPSVWSEPLEFKPERFLTQEKNIELGGKNFELLPFGSGRRMCPGITFSQQVMHLGMARLLQGFELDTIDGLPVDMTESPGFSVPKATPLKVLISPRLSPDLYM